MASLVVSILFSCSKKHDKPQPQNTCLISKAIVNDTQNITFDYNSSGKIRSVTNYYNDGYTRTYIYSENTIVIDLSNQPGNNRKRTVTLNTEGLPENIHDDGYNDPTTWNNYAFEFEGKKCVKQIHTNSSGSNEESLLEWDGDNVGALTTGYTLEYYLNQPVQQADFLMLQYMVEYGLSPIQNANMVKSYTYGSVVPFTYDYDETGKITTMNVNNGETIWKYSYECE